MEADVKKYVIVTDRDEVSLIKKANEINAAAFARAPENSPLIFYEEEEMPVIRAKEALAAKYRRETHSVIPPDLVTVDDIALVSKQPEPDACTLESIPEIQATSSEVSLSSGEDEYNCQEISLVPPTSNAIALPSCERQLAPFNMQRAKAPIPYSGEVLPVHAYRRKPPTPMELEHVLLQQEALYRVESTLYRWNGQYYQRMSSNDVKVLIRSVLDPLLAIDGHPNQVEAVEKLLLTEPSIAGSPLESVPGLINMSNGILDLHRGTFEALDKKYFFTSQLTVPWIPNSSCPRFDDFLAFVTGSQPTLIERFWQAIGYILAPDNSAKRFVFLYGAGNSGKSLLGNLIVSFFHEEDVAHSDIYRLGTQFALGDLVGKRINISMDLPNRVLSDQSISVIKMITGGDKVQVEVKYQPAYPARLNCKLIFASNFPLRYPSQDQAFSKRCLELPFCNVVPEALQDHHLLDALMPERPGILFHAVQAYTRLISSNYHFPLDEQFQSGAAAPAASELSMEDIVIDFLKRCCAEDAQSALPTSQLYSRYLGFCENQGYPAADDKTFSRQLPMCLAQVMPHVYDTKRRFGGPPVNGYCGIRFI